MAPTPPPLILNVNDNEGARYMVTLMLERAGFRVLEAGDGREALAVAAAHAPDLVILDVQLPDIDGFEVCRRLRADPVMASIKVLHTSATFVTLESKVQSLEGGADAYLSQPFEQAELIATCRSLLRLAETERQLRATAASLREEDRRKDELLAMLAHELRNPLSAIAVSLPLLERDPARSPAEARARDVIRRHTTHLGRLVDGLLDVARVTQGRIQMRFQPVDLGALVGRVAESVREAQMMPRGQLLEVVLPREDVFVNGDPLRLEQVLTNVLENASKYTPAGGHVALILDRVKDGREARIRVRDDGIGIAAESLSTIFGLFWQSDVSLDRTRGGLGIGLTLVRRLTELHGGAVKARSNGPGQGSEFEVVLPTCDPPLAGDRPQAVDLGSDASWNGQGSRLLLVEDNRDALESLADLCRLWGFDVVTAATGPGGVARALETEPDIAVVDIGLPELDGFEVARRLRASPFGDRIHLVALTGYGAPEQKARALASGFDLHLVKPVAPDALEKVLTSLVRAPGARTAPVRQARRAAEPS
jgi:signal transduction histidine kinase